VLSNDDGQFAALLPHVEDRDAHLSEILAALAGAGTTVVIAVRPDAHNDTFLTNLRRHVEDEGAVIEHLDPALHEKTLSGDGYVITGSMNFTRAGLDYNEEQIIFEDDASLVAEVRGALRRRWGPT
jgi:phosphatidylserine/phosphatidylglycerophosphate/cardiolipin synthase-like enzyme